MDIFWSKMGQKMGKKYFSQNFNQVIIIKYHKYSFNMKQQQNPKSKQGEIGQNVNFWVKMDIFWSKMGNKMVKKHFFQNFNQVIIVKDHKYSFKMKKQQNPMEERAQKW